MKLYFSNPEKKINVSAFVGFSLAIIPLTVLVINIIINGYSTELNNAIAIFTVVLSIYLCYAYRFNIGLFLVMVFIAYTNYSVAVGVYLFPEIRPKALYAQFSGVDLYGKTILCTLIFEAVFILLSHRILNNPHIIDLKQDEHSEKYEYNNIIAWGALIVYAIMFFTGFRFGTEGNRSYNSALNEYRVIVAIIGSYYSGKKKIFKYAWSFLVLLTGFFVIFGGNRVNIFGSVFLLIVFWYSDFFDYKKFLFMLPFAVVFLAAVGFERGAFEFSKENFINAWEILSKDKLIYEGAVFGYMPSLATMSLVDSCDFQEKLNLFVKHIGYTFTIGKAGDKNPELVFWSREYFTHYNGYISPSYFYMWFKFAGSALFAFLVNAYVKFYNNCINAAAPNKFFNKLKYIISLWFICTVARWYAYGPMGLIRGVFVCSVVYFIVYWIDNFLKGVSK